MKPLHLSLAGLQSYRGMQEVDFSALSELGLFGIFGPTGAGKSTILDAITLALYGKVERAPNRIRGIMNNQERQLSVSLTWEMGLGSSRGCYRVDRRYRRVDETSVVSSYARLVKVTPDGMVPIADKERDVNTAIASLIGLSVDDFTKAVVLPQGKFAEFLKMPGSERTKMLQRLLSLEEYGPALMERLKSRLDSRNRRLEAIDGEMKGLGDCSEQLLKEMVYSLQEKSELVALLDQQLSSLSGEIAQKQQIVAWQEQIKELEIREESLICQQPKLDSLRTAVDLATRAEHLRLPLVDAEAARKHLSDVTSKLSAVESSKTQLYQSHSVAKKRLEDAQTLLQSSEPSLLSKQFRLEAALSTEDEMTKACQELATIEQDRAQLQRLRHQIEGDISILRNQLALSEAKLLGLRTEMQAKTVDPVIRQQVAKCLEIIAHVKRGTETVDRVHRDKQSAEERCKTKRYEENLWQNKCADVDTAWKTANDNLIRHKREKPDDKVFLDKARSLQFYGSVIKDLGQLDSQLCNLLSTKRELLRKQEDIENHLKSLTFEVTEKQSGLSSLLAEKERASVALEQAVASEAVNILSQKLESGLPCPLCGSETHPHPAFQQGKELSQVSVDEFRIYLASLDDSIDDVRSALLALKERTATELATQKSVEDSISQLDNQMANINSRTDELRSSLPDNWQGCAVAQMHEFYSQASMELTELEAAKANWDDKLEKMELAAQELSSKREEVVGLLHQAQSQLTEAETSLGAIKNSLSQATDELEVVKHTYQTISNGMDFDGVSAMAKNISEWDVRCLAIKEEERVLESELAEIRKQLDDEVAHLSVVTTDLSVKDTSIKGLEDSLATKRVQIAQLVGNTPLHVALSEVRDEIDVLKADVKVAQTRVDEATEALQACEVEYANISGELVAAQNAHSMTSNRVTYLLLENGFSDADEVPNHLLSADERETLAGQVDSFDKEVALVAGERQKLENLLDNRSVNLNEYQELVEQHQILQVQIQTVREETAVIRQTLINLKETRVRWEVLESERESLSNEVSYLTRLQGLLRGNAFVEFLAREQLASVTAEASAQLSGLTNGRYSMELDAGGDFSIRDNVNGGALRSAGTLSGGETFLASLSLALALSAHIQLRGEYPLEFFFLDEGFGTLDSELLDTVMNALDRLHRNRLTIGIISHVPELRMRLGRKLIIEPGTTGNGSKVRLEFA